jgi:hypothetical protein
MRGWVLERHLSVTETVDVKIARLEEKLGAIEQKVDFNARLAQGNDKRAVANDEAARQHNADVMVKLTSLISMSDEWRGVRKTLAATGAALFALGGLVGTVLHYFWQKGP